MYTTIVSNFLAYEANIRCFEVSFYKIYLSDMATGVIVWVLNPGSKLPTSFWFSDGYMPF